MEVTLCLCPLRRGAAVYTPRAQFLWRVWASAYTLHHLHIGDSRPPEEEEGEGREGKVWRGGEVGLLFSAQDGR